MAKIRKGNGPRISQSNDSVIRKIVLQDFITVRWKSGVIENDISVVGHGIQAIREGKDLDENKSETIPSNHIVQNIFFSILPDGLVFDGPVIRNQLRSIIKSKRIKLADTTKLDLIPAIASKTFAYCK